MKARIYTEPNEMGRMLVQVVNKTNRKVFNGFIKVSDQSAWNLIEKWEEIWDCTHVNKIGSIKESVAVDKLAYDNGFIVESKFERVFE